MNVLSLFDGISAGRVALERAGIKVNNYYASEIDKYAIQVSNKNYPDIIQLGDITKWREWNIDWSSIDLVIGGSPCQGFSFAGKQLNFDDPRSALFFVFVDICHRVADDNPNMKFLLENVRMKKEYQDVITQYMGINPVAINSSLVSAQNRYRLYWTNIPNVTQPDDKLLLLKDIIQDDVDDKYYLSDEIVNRFKPVDSKSHVGTTKPDFRTIGQRDLVYGEDNKMGCLTATDYKQPKQVLIKVTGAAQRGRYLVDGKSADHTVDSMSGLTEQRIEFREDGKSNCLTSVQKDSLVGIIDDMYKNRPERFYEDKSPTLRSERSGLKVLNNYICRKLTPIECERLQTFPDNYTEGISNSQRYKALGNSWTVDVIAHIFKNLQ